jgi:hypothetical protein
MAEKKPKPETQAERFKRAAREHEADESGETFERAFKKIVPPKRPPPSKKRHITPPARLGTGSITSQPEITALS